MFGIQFELFRPTPFVDLDTAVINTVVDLGSVMVDSGGNLVFNFYVEVTALDGTKYILDVNDLLAAVQVSLNVLSLQMVTSTGNGSVYYFL